MYWYNSKSVRNDEQLGGNTQMKGPADVAKELASEEVIKAIEWVAPAAILIGIIAVWALVNWNPILFGIAFLLCLVLIYAGIAWAKESYRLTYDSQLRRLSPCPKCGGRLVDGEYSGGNNTHYFLYCEKCCGSLPR